MKKIPLTHGHFALVDDKDYKMLSQHTWHTYKNTSSGLLYARTTIRDVDGNWKGIRMHRLLMNAEPGQIVDHKDGNGLNNCRSNLRFANKSQSGANRKRPANNTSGYKGVYWDSTYNNNKGAWRASIKVGKKRIYLKGFPGKEDAARAYDNAARKHFGEFARTNFEEQP